MLAEGLTYQALEPVALCRKTDLFPGDRKSEAGRLAVALDCKHGEIGVGRALRPCKHTLIVGRG